MSTSRCLMAVLTILTGAGVFAQETKTPLRPQMKDDWWQIAGDPDLGQYTDEKQQPVDFGVWQAADGTWQLWSCVRNTKCGGNTRLFYRWEGKRLTDGNWLPMGIAMEADPKLGETIGGLQAPHVIKEGATYWMFYGDWGHICLAKSREGKAFTRVLDEEGRPQLFAGPYQNTRDPMVLKVNDLYHCYYMGHLNTQYCSPNPLSFGVNDDRYRIGTLPVAAPEIIEHKGQYYIAALLPSLKGIRMARLEWVE